ncbi:DUF2497 domain-containing protein [Pseudoroseomonas globiformis]|uniref:DUF2497 domain-containing protein n=1 Tax=Teichococcus globiformis TaxID=2307229 RepID=A0ABV7FWQ6_9PROT
MDDILASIRQRLKEEEEHIPEDPIDLTEDMLVGQPVLPSPKPVAAGDGLQGPYLLGPAATAAAAAALGELARSVADNRSAGVTRGGTTIEDMVREELRPLLKSWLDQHLPSLVEKLVRTEIERLMGRTPRDEGS